MPVSRRGSNVSCRGGGGTSPAMQYYRNSRSFSLGLQQQQQQQQQQQSYLRGYSTASSVSPLASPGGTARPVLRRESAQDFPDDDDDDLSGAGSGFRAPRLNLPQQPPDLKIELLSETPSPSTSSVSPYPSPGVGGPGGGVPNQPNLRDRRPSNCQRAPPISRNKSAPVTPLSRSTTTLQVRMRWMWLWLWLW